MASFFRLRCAAPNCAERERSGESADLFFCMYATANMFRGDTGGNVGSGRHMEYGLYGGSYLCIQVEPVKMARGVIVQA